MKRRLGAFFVVLVVVSGTLGERWAPLAAEEVLVGGLAAQGFAWKVRARIGVLPLTGSDYYARGEARMRMLFLGLVEKAMGEVGVNGFAPRRFGGPSRSHSTRSASPQSISRS